MTKAPCIRIRGADENNLQCLDVDIPRNRFVVVTGVSGSGKSSLVFDTVYKAAQAELLEMIGSYARQSLPRVQRPKLASISGLSPAVAIRQSPLAANPRSTVGTATDIYSHIRLLFSRTGMPILSAGDFSFNTSAGACEACGGLGKTLHVDEDLLIDWSKSLRQGAIRHRTWKVGGRYWNIIAAVGLFDLDKPVGLFSEEERHDLLYREAFDYQNRDPGFVQSFSYEGIVRRIMKRATDSRGGKEYDEQFLVKGRCPACEGVRLNARAREVTVAGVPVARILGMEIGELRVFVDSLEGPVASAIRTSLIHRFQALEDVGLGYLSLNRSMDTLSGGEAQRMKLARQLGSPFEEMIYVLDEPSQGLHSSDVGPIIAVLRALADRTNSVLVVEHDRLAMEQADIIIDMGPGAGEQGGEILQLGSPCEIAKGATPTSKLLAGHLFVKIPKRRRPLGRAIRLTNARMNNLKGLDVDFYAGVLNCVTGVSGSGKSSLIKAFVSQHPEAVIFDQGQAGSSSRSVVATYVDVFDRIRSEVAAATGCPASLLAFNSSGACPTCGGLGYIQMEMHFLGEVREACETCGGRRYSQEALTCTYRDRNMAEILRLSVWEAVDFFRDKDVRERLDLLARSGLGYLQIGQPLGDLSGGERERLRLVEKLSRKSQTYILDEPTRGLHAADIATLMELLDGLIAKGNTLILVEHDLDVIKCADYVVDLGPRGGAEGGWIVARGRPEEVANVATSLTGQALRKVLRPHSDRA